MSWNWISEHAMYLFDHHVWASVFCTLKSSFYGVGDLSMLNAKHHPSLKLVVL
jgi:hypothetical protein